MHHLTAALRAHGLFKRDVDYIVKDGEVIIVDEFTGRTMIGRRWSDGLHQAVEAKEGVQVKEENQTVASITFQNYFRMYGKLAGMTGTADTEAYEFQQIYGLEVVVIPTHKPMIRDDAPDLVYLTQNDKFEAIIEDITDCHTARPARARRHDVDRDVGVPVGAPEEAQDPAPGAEREVPRARGRDRHAGRSARHRDDRDQHGRPRHRHRARRQSRRPSACEARGADRGDDRGARQGLDASATRRCIEMGGLHIVGTERHESRRIDNQLRGRSGRQGDPGSSRFYLSLEDNLMRIFGDPERIKRMLSRAGMKPGEAIESKLLSRQIERAQRKVEAHNFDIRKQLLEYDDVANDQRKVVYQQRAELMEAEDIADAVRAIRAEVVNAAISEHVAPRERRGRCGTRMASAKALEREFGVRFDVAAGARAGSHDRREARCASSIVAAADASLRRRRPPRSGRSSCTSIEKEIMLRQLDSHWKEHIGALDYLRQGIHLRGYAQRNPKQEYKREAFEMFSAMLERVKHDTISDPVEDPDPAARGRAGRRARPRRTRARCASSTRPRRRSSRRRREPAPPPGCGARRPGSALRTRRRTRSPSRRTCASSRRSGATSRARAARARNSSSATAVSADVVSGREPRPRARRADRATSAAAGS